MKAIPLLALLLAWVLPTAAAPYFHFRHIDTQSGLPSNCVRALLQDSTGYIWMGTDGGLVRYDGYELKVFSQNHRQRPGLNDNFVGALCEAGGRLWIGSDTGVYLYDSQREEIVPLPDLKDQQGRTVSLRHTVKDIAADHDGNVWVASEGEGLYRISPDRRHARHYPMTGLDGRVMKIYADSHNNIWAVSTQGTAQLYKLNRVANRFEAFPVSNLSPGKGLAAMALIEDTDHNLWLGSWEDGLQKIDTYTHRATTYLHPRTESGIHHIHSIEAYGPHQLLIGSDKGLSFFNTQTGEHQLYRDDELDRHSLSNPFVYPILHDREGGIWVGTFIGGVNYAQPMLKQFESWQYSRYRNTVTGNVVSRFCEDKGGRIWVATEDGGLSLYDPEKRSFTAVNPLGSEHRLNLHALCLDGDDLWIGSYTQGVIVMNTRNGRTRQYLSAANDPTTLDGNSSYAIHKDSKGTIWVTTMTGLNLYDRDKDCFQRIRKLGALCMDIEEDAHGYLWLATHGQGVYRYHPLKNTWQHYRYGRQEGALPNNHVNCIYLDSNQKLWLGTENGLCQYDEQNDRFTEVPLNMPTPIVCGIVEEQGVMWLTTTRGLVRYGPDKHVYVFTTSDGLSSNQFSPNSILKTREGRIYAGSGMGMNAFYPFQIKVNERVPALVFTSLSINNRRVDVGDKALPLSLHLLDRLELTSEVNTFTVSFASLSYCDPERNQYAYKLEGYDRDWHQVGNTNWATYTNLPPGSYRLMVRGSNNDGQWTAEPIILAIHVQPPWYLSVPMKILYLLLVIAAICLLIIFLLRRAESNHQKDINRLNEARDAEVYQAKMKFFTMIAHEIRTPVSLIIGPLEKIMQSEERIPKEVRTDLNIIERNSNRLLFLVNQLLDFKKVEENAFAVHFSFQPIRPLMYAVAVRFQPSVEQRGGRVEVVYPADDFRADVDAEALTKLMSNLMNNARKYTRDLIRMECEVDEPNNEFRIRVIDNGQGIGKENLQHIFTPFFQVVDHQTDSSKGGTGLGLSLVQSLVTAHHGRVDVQSEIGQGTTFTLYLPIRQPKEAMQPAGDAVKPEETPAETVETDSGVASTQAQPDHQPLMLVVDDNDDMLLFITHNFEQHYRIKTASDGLQALEVLRHHEVDLIVSDWMMPNMDGPMFCRAVRRNPNFSHILFIMLTAKTDNASKTEGMNCGADAYIEKPFSMPYLEACIRNLITMRKLLLQKFVSSPTEPLTSITSNSTDNELLQHLSVIIEENLSNAELSVDFLAEKMGMSRSGLYAKIKNLAEVTPNELIQITRLKKAAAMIREGRYRISEICYMVGFNSSSYFAKCFQKQFGIKPSDYGHDAKEAPTDAPPVNDA